MSQGSPMLKKMPVQYAFSKMLGDESDQNFLLRNAPRLITVTKEDNEIAGRFFYYPQEQFLKFNDTEIRIENIQKIFKKTRRLLIHAQSNERLGEYEILGGGINYSWKDVPYPPNATVRLNNNDYNFRRVAPDIPYWPFDRSTWGQYKFFLYALKGDEFVEYALAMDKPVWQRPRSTNLLPFEGTIQTNSNNMVLLLSGFYLIEAEFEHEDSENSG